MTESATAGVWAVSFGDNPPVPLKGNSITSVAYDPGPLPPFVNAVSVLDHQEFKLDRSPAPSVKIGPCYPATLHDPDGRTQRGRAFIVDWQADGPKEQFKGRFLPACGHSADV